MRRWLAFVAIGSVVATVEEFLTVVVLRHDVPSYVFTLLVLFPIYLSVVAWTAWLFDRVVAWPSRRLVAMFATFGTVGLMMEWTLMGLAPWSNPAANPWLMLGFQLGMFAFWGSVAAVPWVVLTPAGPCQRASRRLRRFAGPYVLVTYGLAFVVPAGGRFATVIPLILGGFFVVAGLVLRCGAELAADENGAHRAVSRPERAS